MVDFECFRMGFKEGVSLCFEIFAWVSKQVSFLLQICFDTIFLKKQKLQRKQSGVQLPQCLWVFGWVSRTFKVDQ